MKELNVNTAIEYYFKDNVVYVYSTINDVLYKINKLSYINIEVLEDSNLRLDMRLILFTNLTDDEKLFVLSYNFNSLYKSISLFNNECCTLNIYDESTKQYFFDTYFKLDNRVCINFVKIDKNIIQTIIEKYYKTSIEVFGRKTRKREIVEIRQMWFYFLKIKTKMSLREIGETVTPLKDHATVIHACKTIEALYESSKKIKKEVDEINIEIREFCNKHEILG